VQEQQTALPNPVLLHLQSERFGRLNLNSVRLAIPDMPDHLVVLLPPADDETRQVVARWFRQHEHRGAMLDSDSTDQRSAS